MNDRTRVTLRVAAPRALAFEVFTSEIDAWWRHGKKYRVGPEGTMAIEPRLGGRFTETFVTNSGKTRTVLLGEVLAWEPPSRLVLSFRPVNFRAIDPSTEIEVTFERAIGHSGEGTLVMLEHRGWSRVREDHPVRHGQPPKVFIATMGRWWGDLLSSLRQYVAEKT